MKHLEIIKVLSCFLFLAWTSNIQAQASVDLSVSETQRFEEMLQRPSSSFSDYLKLDNGRYVKMADLLRQKLDLERPIDLIRNHSDLKGLPYDLGTRDIVYLRITGDPADYLSPSQIQKVARFCQSRGRKFLIVQVQSKRSKAAKTRQADLVAQQFPVMIVNK